MVAAPELKRFMDSRVRLKLNANRTVEGILRGYDPFMNVVVDESVEATTGASGRAEKIPIGMIVVRGNSISMIEGLDPVVMREQRD